MLFTPPVLRGRVRLLGGLLARSVVLLSAACLALGIFSLLYSWATCLISTKERETSRRSTPLSALRW